MLAVMAVMIAFGNNCQLAVMGMLMMMLMLMLMMNQSQCVSWLTAIVSVHPIHP